MVQIGAEEWCVVSRQPIFRTGNIINPGRTKSIIILWMVEPTEALIYDVFEIIVITFSMVFKYFIESVQSFLSLFRSGIGCRVEEGRMKKRCHICKISRGAVWRLFPLRNSLSDCFRHLRKHPSYFESFASRPSSLT